MPMTDHPGHRLRLLYLITTFSVGGAERHLYDLVSRLPSDAYDVTVAFFKEEAQEARSLVPDFRALGVDVVDLRMTSRWDVAALWRLFRLLRHLRPDILHAHLYRAELFGVLTGRLAGVPGIVCTMHNANLYMVHKVLRRLLAMAYRFADRVITLFDEASTQLRNDYRVPGSRLVTIHHGYNAVEQDPPPKHEPAGTGNVSVVGTVGRLAKQKAHDVLLNALAQILRRRPGTRLTIAGHDDEGLRPELEALSARLELQEAVQFKGYVDNIQSFLDEIDVFVLSSDNEGLPISLLEAMAVGKPIVATRVGGVPEVVVDGVTGLLVPTRDPEALADAILRLLEDPSEARRMGARGRERLMQQFTMERMVERTCAVYREVAGEKGLAK